MGGRGLRLAALVVPVGLGAVALAHTGLVIHMAVHLCGWPATVSCDFGVPVVWWVLLAGLWGVAVVAAVDAAAFVWAPTRSARWRLLSWGLWGPAVVVTTVATMQDRELHALDIVLGSFLVAAALVLLASTVWSWLPVSRTVVVAGFAVPLLAVVAVPVWAPAAFQATERAEPARQERARRQASEECQQRLAEGREADVPAGAAQPACEIYPAPEGPTPPALPDQKNEEPPAPPTHGWPLEVRYQIERFDQSGELHSSAVHEFGGTGWDDWTAVAVRTDVDGSEGRAERFINGRRYQGDLPLGGKTEEPFATLRAAKDANLEEQDDLPEGTSARLAPNDLMNTRFGARRDSDEDDVVDEDLPQLRAQVADDLGLDPEKLIAQRVKQGCETPDPESCYELRYVGLPTAQIPLYAEEISAVRGLEARLQVTHLRQ